MRYLGYSPRSKRLCQTIDSDRDCDSDGDVLMMGFLESNMNSMFEA